MNKQVSLKDGTEITIRTINEDDIDRSLAFFSGLPEEDRAYLRTDVTKREIVERRIRTIDPNRVRRLVAVIDDQIIADGTIESEGHSWKEHIAELRLIVARPYQRLGLGMLMARELYFLAARKNVEEIVVRFMAPQTGARRIFKKLGFHKDAVLRDYVKDINGHKQDLVIMRCNLEALWRKLEIHIKGSDWQRTR
jgi:L-amino acid N-acyltransferase YncA